MYRIGIDLGGTFIAAGLVDESLRILDKLSVPTNAPRSMAGIADDMAALAGKLLERSGLRREELAAVGVGVPGTANRENGHLEDANNLGFDDEPFVSVLEERLGLPVRFGNDANAAAWGEYKVGGGREDSFVMMTIGTGIGGGVILNGSLWDGINGAAAGDKACRALLDTYTTYLAEGTANIINLFQPAVLCVGGGVSRAGEALLAPLREKTARRIYSQNAKQNTQIILAQLDNDAGIIGAALLEP